MPDDRRHTLGLPPAGDFAVEIVARLFAEIGGPGAAALVAHRGQLDDQVQRLLDEGWTIDEDRPAFSFGGKRVRFLRPPAPIPTREGAGFATVDEGPPGRPTWKRVEPGDVIEVADGPTPWHAQVLRDWQDRRAQAEQLDEGMVDSIRRWARLARHAQGLAPDAPIVCTLPGADLLHPKVRAALAATLAADHITMEDPDA